MYPAFGRLDEAAKKSYFSKTIAMRGDLSIKFIRETEKAKRAELLSMV